MLTRSAVPVDRAPRLQKIGAEATALVLLIAPAGTIATALVRRGGACGALVNVFDVRLVNYFLEWAYRYLRSGAGSESLWSPPFFYPTKNVLAYSETFFAAWPLYFPARLLGLGPHGALLFYQLAELALTPAIAYLCGRWLGLGRIPAFVAAWCFGWSWVRFSHFAHIQFANGWVIALIFALLYRAFHDARPWLLVAAAWSLCCAWFTALYVMYFSVVVALLATGLWVAQGPRDALARTYAVVARARSMRARERLGWVLLMGVPIALMLYGAYHYRLAARVVGPGDPEEALFYQPSLWSFLRPDSGNLLWGRFAGLLPSDTVAPWEKQLFLGWLALGCLPFALAWPTEESGVSRRALRSACLAVLIGALLVAHFPSEMFNKPYLFALHHLPGFAALRVTGRIALVLSALSAFLSATVVQGASRRAPFAAGALALGLMLEATPPLPPIVDRCEADRPWNALEPSLCRATQEYSAGALLFLPMEAISFERIFDQVPEMTLALNCEVATINGYTGKEAPIVAPLLHSDPARFNCTAARAAIDAAAASSRKNTLVYLEEVGPLGPPGYPSSAVAECLSTCLSGRSQIIVEGRKGQLLVLDHQRSCRAGLLGPSEARVR